MEVHDRRRPTEMSYFPEKDRAWEITGGREAKLSPIRIEEAINFAEQNETLWPKDIHIDGSIPMLTDIENLLIIAFWVPLSRAAGRMD